MLKMSNNDYEFINKTLKDMIDSNSLEETRAMSRVILNYITSHTTTETEMITLRADTYFNRIAVIKELRMALNIGLKEAKDLTEQPNGVIYKSSDIKKCMELYKAIQRHCNVTIDGSDALKILFGVN